MLFNVMWTEIFKMQTPLETKHSEVCACERVYVSVLMAKFSTRVPGPLLFASTIIV